MVLLAVGYPAANLITYAIFSKILGPFPQVSVHVGCLKVTIICRYILCNFGLKYVSQVLIFALCTLKWYRVDKFIYSMFTGTKFAFLGQSAEISNISTCKQ